MSEELITFDGQILNKEEFYIDNEEVSEDLYYKIRNKCKEENKIIEENQQLKEKLNCDLEWALKYDELYKENQQLKEINKELISVLKIVKQDVNFVELCDGYLVTRILDKVKE